MSEIRFITSSDEHVADLNPGFRKDDYRSAILKKLEWQGGFSKKFNSTAFLRGGDLYHLKASNKVTYRTSIDLINIHQQYGCPIYSLAGNHDMSYNDPATLVRQPLGVLFSSGVISHLKDEQFFSGSMKVRVVGVDFTTDLDNEALCDAVRKKKDDGYVIAFVHALAAHAPNDRFQAFFNERIFDYRDLVFDGCPDVYIFGHYHKDQGIKDHLGVKFVNLGAVSRGALTFENLDRKPKISSIIFNSQGISIEEHEIPCADAAQIFNLELKLQIEKKRRTFEEFISKFKGDSNLSAVSGVASKLDALKKSPDYSDDLKKVVMETWEASEAGLLDD